MIKEWQGAESQETNDTRHRVYEDIVDTIMQQIREGSLKPGSKLPAERKLASQFNASRTAVREAIRTLASRGFIETRVGDGTFIREVRADDVFMSLPDVLTGDGKLIRDVLDVRILLETETASRAALYAKSRDIHLLEDSIEKMQTDVSAGRSGMDNDGLFHQRLADASGNEAMAQILTICSDLLMKSTRNSLSEPGRPQESVDDHRLILNAVRRHDPDGASRAMETHLKKGYSLIRQDSRDPASRENWR